MNDDFSLRKNDELDDFERLLDDGHSSLGGEDAGDSRATPSVAATTVRSRWGGDERIIEHGFLAVPRSFFFNASTVGLTPAEAAFVLHLMAFKWSEADPYPGYELLGQRLGVSTKQARKYAAQLEAKGLLNRVPRFDRERGERTSNAFDLQPLFDRLSHAVSLNSTGRLSRSDRRDVAHERRSTRL